MPIEVAIAQIAWPATMPSAVKTPPRRPPSNVLRMVRAVSGPGVTMTSADTPRKARNVLIMGRLVRSWITGASSIA